MKVINPLVRHSAESIRFREIRSLMSEGEENRFSNKSTVGVREVKVPPNSLLLLN